MRQERIIKQVDKMVKSARITEEEQQSRTSVLAMRVHIWRRPLPRGK